MNSSNIKRYGGVTVFIVAVVICALFFVQVLALMQGYSDNISDQAVERARFLTGKQADALKNKYTELKLKTDKIGKIAQGVHLNAYLAKLAKTAIDYKSGWV